MFEIKRIISNNDCKENRDKIFLYGDNLDGYGKAGQAIIRDNENAFGIATKVHPTLNNNAFMNDDLHYKLVRDLLKTIWKSHLNGKTIVVPEFRFGYGLSQIDKYAPKIANLINDFYSSVYDTLDLKYYAGIGSRETPKHIGELMGRIATNLEKNNYILRSGGAEGGDTFFENGVKNKKDIYLPWCEYNNNKSDLIVPMFIESERLARENHSYWATLKNPVKKLMVRNVYQVLGMNMAKQVDFIICWTKDGCESHTTRTISTGGTGMAISLASKLEIPIYNLKNEKSLEFVLNNLIKGEF